MSGKLAELITLTSVILGRVVSDAKLKKLIIFKSST